MMRNALILSLFAALPALTQENVQPSVYPVATVEGWGTVSLRVPPEYEVTCLKRENEFIFTLAKPKSAPALEIYNGFAPPLAGEGENCYAKIAGKRCKGTIVPQENGGETHEFLLPDGPSGSTYLITLHGGPDAKLMQEVMETLSFDTPAAAPDTAPEKEAAPPPPPTVQTFSCKGSFTLTVPGELRVVETKAEDAYYFHFLTAKGERALTIYSGYSPAVQTGGAACTAEIAGKSTEGNKLTGEIEPAAALIPHAPGAVPGDGEEYVVPGGADGALYHLIVYESPLKKQVLAMLAAMRMSGGSPLPESARQQSTALRESAEACVRAANILLARVTDRATADAAARELLPLADTMQANDKAAAALQRRYGRALHAYLHAPDKSNAELSPGTKQSKNQPENEIQRVHEADCYGSEALENLLLRFMGIDND